MLTRFQKLYKAEAGTYQYPANSLAFDIYSEAGVEFSERMHQVIRRQYIEYESRFSKQTLLRPSCLGCRYPFDILASKFLNLPPASYCEQTKLTFMLGDFIETWVAFTFERLGYKVERDVEANSHGLEGTVDMVVTDEDNIRYLIEVKSCSDYAFNKFRSEGVTDDRGYLTQLLLYQEALNIPAYWVFVNKNTSDICLISLNETLPPELREVKLDDIDYLVDLYHSVLTMDEVSSVCPPPPPAIEKDIRGNYKRDKNDNLILYVPTGACFPSMYYEVEKRGKRLYVTGLKEQFKNVDLTKLALEEDDRKYKEKLLIKHHFLR